MDGKPTDVQQANLWAKVGASKTCFPPSICQFWLLEGACCSFRAVRKQHIMKKKRKDIENPVFADSLYTGDWALLCDSKHFSLFKLRFLCFCEDTHTHAHTKWKMWTGTPLKESGWLHAAPKRYFEVNEESCGSLCSRWQMVKHTFWPVNLYTALNVKRAKVLQPFVVNHTGRHRGYVPDSARLLLGESMAKAC